MSDNSSWEQYQKLVLAKLDDHGKDIGKIREDTARMRVEVGALKVRSGIWGALAGVIPALGVAIFWLLSH